MMCDTKKVCIILKISSRHVLYHGILNDRGDDNGMAGIQFTFSLHTNLINISPLIIQFRS